MALPDEIRLMEEIAEKLREWAKVSSDAPQISDEKWRDRMKTIIDLLVELSPVMDWLLSWNSALAKPVRKQGIKLMHSAGELVKPTLTGFEYSVLVTDFRCEISNFADRLLHIAKMARKEREHRRVKLILYAISAVVTFLAALLRIFSYLGWL